MRAGRAAVGRSKAGRIALYSGSFLGPFAGGLTNSILPEIGGSFGLSADAASASITAYMVPFIAALLVSAPLGTRWGVRRTVAAAYLLFVVASLLAAIAPVWWLFLIARGLQGLANAFTTPLLLVVVGSIIPREKLGAALGLVASMQAAGTTLAPALSGVAAHLDWRWAFGAVAVAGLVFWYVPIPEPSEAKSGSSRLRDAWTWPAVRLAVVYFLIGLTFIGSSFLLALYVGEEFGLPHPARPSPGLRWPGRDPEFPRGRQAGRPGRGECLSSGKFVARGSGDCIDSGDAGGGLPDCSVVADRVGKFGDGGGAEHVGPAAAECARRPVHRAGRALPWSGSRAGALAAAVQTQSFVGLLGTGHRRAPCRADLRSRLPQIAWF